MKRIRNRAEKDMIRFNVLSQSISTYRGFLNEDQVSNNGELLMRLRNKVLVIGLFLLAAVALSALGLAPLAALAQEGAIGGG